MPKLTTSLPKYRKHRASGQAIVTIGRKDFYLGLHGSKASKLEYDRIITEWLAVGRPSTWPPAEAAEVTIAELIRAYWRWAQGYYRDKTGESSGTAETRLEAFSRLVRPDLRCRLSTPLPGARLSEDSDVDPEICEQRLRDILIRGGELIRDDGGRAFAFKLHQFIGQGRALFATLEPVASGDAVLACWPASKARGGRVVDCSPYGRDGHVAGSAGTGEFVELLIDSNADRNSLYRIRLAPEGGGQVVCSYHEHTPPWHDRTWQRKFDCAVAWQSDGWTAKFALPFDIFCKNQTLAAEIGFNVRWFGMPGGEVRGWHCSSPSCSKPCAARCPYTARFGICRRRSRWRRTAT